MKINKSKVQKLLVGLQTIDPKRVADDSKPDTMDLKKFNELPEVVEVINQLKEMGVDKKWLFSNGFMLAEMVLKI